MYDKNINKIDELINDEKLLGKYIEEIENNDNFEIPSDLNDKILGKLNINKTEKVNENNNEKVIKFKKIEILKVACFSLLAVVTWNVMFMFGDNNLDVEKKINEEVAKQEKIEQVKLNVDKVTDKITTFFIVPTLGNEGSNV